MANECPKCSQCGTQMNVERIYGIAKACRCPSCGYKVAYPGASTAEQAFKRKRGERNATT